MPTFSLNFVLSKRLHLQYKDKKESFTFSNTYICFVTKKKNTYIC